MSDLTTFFLATQWSRLSLLNSLSIDGPIAQLDRASRLVGKVLGSSSRFEINGPIAQLDRASRLVGKVLGSSGRFEINGPIAQLDRAAAF